MFAIKFLVVLFAVLNCFSDADAQPNQKVFRRDYQYIGSTKAYYKIHTVRRSWQEAKDKCESEGSLLFYPKDDDEAYAIISLWNETQPFNVINIGISAPHSKQVFETVDGLPISSVYNKWAPGEPNDEYGREGCVAMYRDGNLNDVPCTDSSPFICKKSLDSIEWNEQCNLPDLSYQFSEKTKSCYKFHVKPMNWADAYAQCHSEQSHLAVINSQDEADFLVDITNKAEKDNVKGEYLRGAVHLGFQEKDDKWLTIIQNTPLSKSGYAIWGANQPDGKGQEKCGSMFYNGKLNDIDCNEKLFFVCEHPVN